MKLIKQSILLFLLFPMLLLEAQDFPKTIYQLFEIQEGGCSYESIGTSDESVESEVAFVDSAPPPPPPPPMTGTTLNKDLPPSSLSKVLESLTQFKKEIATRTDHTTLNKKILQNGNSCFYENGKWGLQDVKKKVILKPQFDFVVVDTFANGFAGYKSAMGNYYDGKTGKQQLDKNYYFIDAVAPDVFIVQTIDGFGILDQGKTVVETKLKGIKVARGKDRYYYHMTNAQKGEYVLLDDQKTTLPFPSFYEPKFIGNDYAFGNYNFYNLKSKKKLVCENGFRFSLLSEEYKLLSIKGSNSKFTHLIDFEGNIISENLFSSIGAFNSKGIASAMIEEKNPNGYRPIKKYGLIDQKGNWIIDPQFYRIENAGDFWMITNLDKKRGLLSSEGKEILPQENDVLNLISDGRFLFGTKTKEKIESKIINVNSGKIEQEGLHISHLHAKKFCGTTLLLATLLKGTQMVDQNLKPITGVHSYFYSFDGFIVGQDGGYSKATKQLYDCQGNKISFTIDRIKKESFQEVKVLKDKLSYVYFEDGTGFIISKDGKSHPLNERFQKLASANFSNLLVASSDASNGSAGMIDENAKIVFPFDFKSISTLNQDSGMFSFRTKDKKAGLFSPQGDLITNALYDWVRYKGFGLYVLEDGGHSRNKKGLVDKNGKLLIPVKYKRINLVGGLIFASDGKEELIFDRSGKKLN